MKMKFSDLYFYISESVDLWMLVELKNLRFILVYDSKWKKQPCVQH